MKEIYEKLNLVVEEVNEKNKFNSWGNVKEIMLSRHHEDKSKEAWRRMYYRSKEYSFIDNVVKKDELSHEIKKDGTQVSEKLLTINQAEMIDPNYLLKAHGYNPNLFDLITAKSNLWSKDNYQSKIIVKPISKSELSKDEVVEIVSSIKPLDIDLKIKTVDKDLEKYALEVDFADVHIGSLSWHDEVGEDNDYKLTFDRIKRQVTKARRIIENENIEKLYLCFLGDFLHIDNDGMTTTKGTKVDFDTRPKKMVQKSIELMMYIIDNLAIVPTDVIWIEGNHSRLVEFTMFQILPHAYANVKHIKFDVSPKIRKAFMYGDNLIGLHHGEINKAEMFNWVQVEFRELWGKAKYVEQHSGHIHQEKATEKGGIIQRTNPTSKSLDMYEYQNGWVSEKLTMAYLWHKTDKLQSMIFLR